MKSSENNTQNPTFKFLNQKANQKVCDVIDQLVDILRGRALDIYNYGDLSSEDIGFLKGLKFAQSTMLKERLLAERWNEEHCRLEDELYKEVFDYLCEFVPSGRTQDKANTTSPENFNTSCTCDEGLKFYTKVENDGTIGL